MNLNVGNKTYNLWKYFDSKFCKNMQLSLTIVITSYQCHLYAVRFWNEMRSLNEMTRTEKMANIRSPPQQLSNSYYFRLTSKVAHPIVTLSVLDLWSILQTTGTLEVHPIEFERIKMMLNVLTIFIFNSTFHKTLYIDHENDKFHYVIHSWCVWKEEMNWFNFM